MSNPTQKPEPFLRVLGPLSISALSAVSNALPPGTAMRSAGTVEHGGQTRAVFEFIECAGIQESNDGKTCKEVNQ